MIDDKIHGNEYVMNISQSTWEDCGRYWMELADSRTKATKRETVIVVEDRVLYRAQSPTIDHVRETGK